MFEKFIKLFFIKKPRDKKCKTYYGKKRERSKTEERLIVKKICYEKTCLSVYFENLKGLNLSGRGYAKKVSGGHNRLKSLKSADFYR